MNAHLQHKEICRMRGLFLFCQLKSLEAIVSSSNLRGFLATRLFNIATSMTLSYLTLFLKKSYK